MSESANESKPKSRNKIPAPRTAEEFMASPWAKKALTKIRTFNLREDREDTMAEFVVHCVEKKHFENYDENLYCFSSYFYGLLNNFCCKRLKHENWDSVRRVEAGPSLNRKVGYHEDGKVIELGHLVAESRSVDNTNFNENVEIIMAVLSAPKFKAHSTYVNPKNGLTYSRDLRTIFSQLLGGYSRTEIAENLGTSPSYIMSKIAELRKLPEIREALSGFLPAEEKDEVEGNITLETVMFAGE